MKTPFLLIILLFSSMSLSAQWKPAGDKIKTAWAEKLILTMFCQSTPAQ